MSPDTVSFLNVSTRFYLSVDAVRNIAILYSRSPTMLKHSSSIPLQLHSIRMRQILPFAHARPTMPCILLVIGRARASPPSRTTGTIFLFASSVSPDTVSLLNVSTRFYLGVHAVGNIATTVYGLWKLYHGLQTLGPYSARVDTTPRASANEEHVGLYVGS